MSQKKDETKKRVVQKYNLNEVEDLWGSGLADERTEADDDLYGLDDLLSGDGASGTPWGDGQGADAGGESLGGADLLYSDSYSQDIFEDSVAGASAGEEIEPAEDFVDEGPAQGAIEEVPPAEEAEPVVAETCEFAAQVEFIGGMRQEVAKAQLFAPEKNTLLLVDPETNDELIVFFEQLTCLRISGLPPGITERQKDSSVREIIETVDGASHKVLVCSRQELDGLLCCFSPEEQTVYPVTIFPRPSIRKRTQDRQLTDILLEKRFVSRTILQRARQEFAQLKGLTFDKIIAQKARIPLPAIEEALDNARKNGMSGLQTGEILLLSGLVTEEQVLDALEYQERIQDLEIGQFLLAKGIVKEIEVYIALAEQHKIPFLDLRQRKISRESLTILPKDMLVQHEILPLVKRDDVVLVATHLVNTDHLRESILKAAACKEVKYVLSPPSQIRKIITLIQGEK